MATKSTSTESARIVPVAVVKDAATFDPQPGATRASTRAWLRSLPALLDELARECCALLKRCCPERRQEKGNAASCC